MSTRDHWEWRDYDSILCRIERVPNPDVEAVGLPRCWNWTGSGVGQRRGSWNGMAVTRAVYMIFVGPLADDVDLDHLCLNTRCVNPAHLEPVSTRVNLQRKAMTLDERLAALRLRVYEQIPNRPLTRGRKRGANV